MSTASVTLPKRFKRSQVEHLKSLEFKQPHWANQACIHCTHWHLVPINWHPCHFQRPRRYQALNNFYAMFPDNYKSVYMILLHMNRNVFYSSTDSGNTCAPAWIKCKHSSPSHVSWNMNTTKLHGVRAEPQFIFHVTQAFHLDGITSNLYQSRICMAELMAMWLLFVGI